MKFVSIDRDFYSYYLLLFVYFFKILFLFYVKLPQAAVEMGNKESNVDYSTATVEAPTTSVMAPAVKLPNRNSLCLETGHGNVHFQ